MIMKKNVLWNLKTDYTVSCGGVMSDYGISPSRRQIYPQIYLYVSGCSYLLKDSLLTGLHNIYLNIRQYPSKNWN
jgi:hypothetical protein